MIEIITDSTSDITLQEAKKYGITVVPLTVHFGDEEFLDGVTITPLEFYEKLIECEQLPKTSQATPFAYAEAYQNAVQEGKEIIVTIIDSENAAIGEKALVLKAIELRDKGCSLEEMTAQLEEAKKHLHLLALLNTLEYLKKGGRISAAAALAGSIIGIKPVITIKDGAIEVVGKARGSKTGNNMLSKFINESGQINFNEPLCLGYTGNDPHPLDKYIEDSKELYKDYNKDFDITVIGGAIGTHAGPGCIAIAYFDKLD